jgi:peptide/nickel transport system permease protein
LTLYIARRLIQAAFVLVLMSLVVFFGVYAIGDPVELLIPPEASPAQRSLMTERLGLDRPVWWQYLVFLGNAAKGDLGTSFVHGVPALRLILERLPATLELVLVSMAIAIAIGLPLGMAAGLRPETRWSRAVMTGSVLGFSLPSFWQGMMLILLFAVVLGWLPASGRGPVTTVLGWPTSLLAAEGWAHIALPATNLAIGNAALVIRLAAAGTAEARLQDFVRFARAKGVRPARIVGLHILKVILIPLVTVTGIEVAGLIAFSTITETVFAWPGMGKLLIDSIYQLDRPVVVAYILVATFLFVLVNLIVDLLYAALDPRVRLADEAR